MISIVGDRLRPAISVFGSVDVRLTRKHAESMQSRSHSAQLKIDQQLAFSGSHE